MDTIVPWPDGAILSADNLTRSVATPSGIKAIIDSFSFTFDSRGMYTIVGPSGSGKTSLLRLFNRLDEKSSGQLLFHDQPVEQYPVTKLRKKIALVFQVPYLFPGTVNSNLAYCCLEETKPDETFSYRFLNLVGLETELADRDVETLSVGQKQRVALARALVLEPEILLLDEPTSALDPGAARTIEDLIIALNRKLGLTIIMVTHNFRQALDLDGISLVMVDGEMIETGPSRELMSHPRHEITRKFIAGELR
ncbi:MAG: ATP-binding cassette domain-containing protein [candidate division Zixibacteria bacterium]|nr:ATP-binding cassette domain-containing protein [candidate division Zixibacteria bacterium]